MYVGLNQSFEDLNRTESLTFPQVREFCPVQLPLNREINFFPAFGLQLKHQLFLGLEPGHFQIRTTTFALLGFQLADSPCRSFVVVQLLSHV